MNKDNENIMKEFNEFYLALFEAGFEDSELTILALFNDEVPETEQLSWQEERTKFEEVSLEYDYTHIEQDGGGEGGSEYCYGVIKIKDKFYKAEWSYYSYNGYDHDGITDTIREVKPVTKTITVYE